MWTDSEKNSGKRFTSHELQYIAEKLTATRYITLLLQKQMYYKRKNCGAEKAWDVILRHTFESLISLHVALASTAYSYLSMHNVLHLEEFLRGT